MKKFRKLSVTTKVFLSPVLVMVILLGAAVMSYVGSLKQEAALDHVVNVAFKKASTSSDIRQVINYANSALMHVIALADSGIEDEKIEIIRKKIWLNIAGSGKMIADFEKISSLDKNEIKILQRIKEALSGFEKIAGEIMDLASIDRMIAIPMMEEVSSRQVKLDRAATDFCTLESRMAEETFSASNASARSRRDLFMWLVVGALLISLIVTILVSRSITVPLEKVITGLAEGSEQVATASHQISSSSKRLAKGSSDQATAIEQTSSSLEMISSMTGETAANAKQAKDLVKQGDKIIETANDSMDQLTSSMDEISKASQETFTILKTIDEIAFQTNLLALNAAVEAARAGEAGSGFAVVAQEVRNLAKRSAEAAQNTSELIEGTVLKINNGSELVSKTNHAFSMVAENSTKVGAIVDDIALTSNEQNNGIEKVNNAAMEMDNVIRENSENAKGSASASEEMDRQACRMRDFVQDLVSLTAGAKSS